MSTAIAIRDEARKLVDEMRTDLKTTLPTTISVERFQNTFIIAASHNPKIFECERSTIKTALLKAASDNLLPDNREAAIVPYNTKVKIDGKEVWQVQAQYMPMVQGVRKRALELGGVRIDAEVVYENDFFDAEFGDTPFIKHKPAVFKDRGEIVGAYAIFKDDKTGNIVHREAMSREEIEKSRSVSKAANSPAWMNFYQEMARKTVLRRGSKSVPTLPDEMRTIIEREDEFVDFNQDTAERATRTIDHNPLVEDRKRTPSSAAEQRTSNSQVDGSSPSASSKDSSSSTPTTPEDGGDDRRGGSTRQRLPADLFRKYASQVGRMATADSVQKAHAMFWSEADHPKPENGTEDHLLASIILSNNVKRANGEIQGDGFADEIESLISDSFKEL